MEQVKAGMTRSQVRYLLGTPMVADSFNKERWDYIYYLKKGRTVMSTPPGDVYSRRQGVVWTAHGRRGCALDASAQIKSSRITN